MQSSAVEHTELRNSTTQMTKAGLPYAMMNIEITN